MADNTHEEEFYFPELSQSRIKELEAMLPERPEGMGRPASDRSARDALAATEEARKLVESAEPLLHEDFPELTDELFLRFRKNGNRTDYESVLSKRTAMINKLVFAECFEYRGRFIDKLEEFLEQLLSQRSWVLPAHDYNLKNFNDEAPFPDLVSSETACMVAYIDWFLQDRLSPEIRRRIRKEAMHRAIAPYQKVIRGECGNLDLEKVWTVSISNWNAVCTSNMLSACLILLESRHERAEVLAAMELSNKFFYKGFTSDGYCSEGLGYWGYGFGHFLTMAETVLAATDGRLNIYDDDPVLRKCCEYPRNIMIEDGVAPAYADCNFKNYPSDANMAIIQRHYPELLLHPIPKQPRQSSLREFALFAFADDAPADASLIQPLPPFSFFKDAGVLLCRSTDGDGNRFGASIKGGHNSELHNHNDVGSYVVVVNGNPLVADYGAEIYTKRTFSKDRYLSKILSSYGHDVPVVAGQLQKEGPDAKGVIIDTSFREQTTSILFDMTSCYDVKELVSLRRLFVFDRAIHAVIVSDTVEFSSPQPFEDAILTNAEFDIASKSHVRFHGENATLKASIDVKGADWSIESEIIDNPGRISPTRLGIKLDKPVLKAMVMVVYAQE